MLLSVFNSEKDVVMINYVMNVCVRTRRHQFVLNLEHILRADVDDGDSAELHHLGDVPAVYRRALRHNQVPGSSRLRPLHLRLLRCRNDRQDDGHGCVRQRNLLSGNLEQTRLFYRCGRVSKIFIPLCISIHVCL